MEKSKINIELIEEIVRESFGLDELKETPETLSIPYNDLIEYTKFIVENALQSSTKIIHKVIKTENTKPPCPN